MNQSQRRRSSIRSRLFLAFGTIAGTTVLASFAACLWLSQIGGLMVGVAEGNIPAVINSLELAARTEALVAAAPGLMRADTQAIRTAQAASVHGLQDDISRRLDSLAASQSGSQSIANLARMKAALFEKLQALDAAVEKRLQLASQRQGSGAAAEVAHKRVLDIVTPALEKARSDITMVSMTISNDATQSTMTLLKLVSSQVPLADGLAGLVGDVNLASGLRDRASLAPTVEAVEALRGSFKILDEELQETLDIVESLQPTPGLRPAMMELLAGGTGAASVFAQRIAELQAGSTSQQLLQDTRSVATDFTTEVSHQVDAVRREAKLATDRSDAAIRFGTLTMFIIAGLSIASAALIMWLYIGRSLIARIGRIAEGMGRLADGDLTSQLALTGPHDEIGQMAGTLVVFRDSMIRARDLAAEQATAQAAKTERAVKLDAMVRVFEGQVGEMVDEVTKATTTMGATAHSMSATVAQASDRTTTVAAAAEQASGGVQTVAAAADQLTGSIREITRQVTEFCADDRPSGGGCSANRWHRAGPGRRCAEDRRRGGAYRGDRRSDQPLGPERDDRGGTRR